VLYVPAIGPFLAMPYVDTSDGGWAILLLDGVIQSVGALGIIIGFADRQERLVRNDAGRMSPRLRLLPSFSAGRAGFQLVGNF
jgi:hypothetical protein